MATKVFEAVEGEVERAASLAEVLLEKLEAALSWQYRDSIQEIKAVPYEPPTANQTSCELLPDDYDELSNIQQSWYRTAERLSRAVAQHVGAKPRLVTLGKSSVADGWTDGFSKIVISASFLRSLGNNQFNVVSLILLMIHEYLHDTASLEMMVHGAEFYESFHDAMDNLGDLLEQAVQIFEVELAPVRNSGASFA
jgi:hypothetical protein